MVSSGWWTHTAWHNTKCGGVVTAWERGGGITGHTAAVVGGRYGGRVRSGGWRTQAWHGTAHRLCGRGVGGIRVGGERVGVVVDAQNARTQV